MTASNLAKSSCHVVTATILLLVGFGLCGCNQKQADEPQKPAEIPKKVLPETYGIYALVNGKYEQLNSSLASPPTLPATAEFLIFDRSLAVGLGNPDRIVQLQERTYVRKEVEHIKPDREQPATGLEVKDAGYFLPTTTKLAVRFGPVENRQDMLKTIPVSAMSRGLYYLKVGNDDYSFSVGISEQDGKKIYAVDKHITTVKNQWSDRREVVDTDHMETGALDRAIQELKSKAQSSLQKDELKNGFEYARNYLRFNPQDDAFAQEIRGKTVSLYQTLTNRELWGCAILLAREAASLKVSDAKEMEQQAKDKLAEWNNQQASQGKERLQKAKRASRTYWTQGNLPLTVGNNLPDKGRDTVVTDVGVDTVRIGREEVHIWWGDSWGFGLEGDTREPVVRFNRGYTAIGFFFPPGNHAKDFYNTCAKTFADFRKTNSLSWWSCKVTDQSSVLWTMWGGEYTTFAPPISFPPGWKMKINSDANGFILESPTKTYSSTGERSNPIPYPWNGSSYENVPSGYSPPDEPLKFLSFGNYTGSGEGYGGDSVGFIKLRIELAMP
jgi:hypothetical protein